MGTLGIILATLFSALVVWALVDVWYVHNRDALRRYHETQRRLMEGEQPHERVQRRLGTWV